VKTTRYYREKVKKERPYLSDGWAQRALDHPEFCIRQKDGRWRYWVYIPEWGMYFRVITLADGLTVHNMFPDRDFRGGC